MNHKFKGNLSVDSVSQLTQIFDSKNWPTIEREAGNIFPFFEKFCQLLSILSKNEQNLILTLTKDFLRCPFSDYFELLKNSLLKINQTSINNSEEIFVLPLVSPEDEQRDESKSGHFLIYPAVKIVIPYLPSFNGKNIISLMHLSFLNNNYPNRNNALILFLDDFIGTGETAIKTLTNFKESYSVQSDSFVIVALVAQERGVAKISEHSYLAVAANIRKRGISDSESITDKRSAFLFMDQVEARLQMRDDFLRGYRKSEALVKMMRTPNNTFPVYWCPKSSNNKPWPAPFPRTRT